MEVLKEEVGRTYARAAAILRSTGEFGLRPDEALTALNHTYDESRTELHHNSERFSRQIERLALQVEGSVSDEAISFDFVVNLEAFSRFQVDENDVDGLKKLAISYVPVRLREWLAPAARGERRDYYEESTSSVGVSFVSWGVASSIVRRGPKVTPLHRSAAGYVMPFRRGVWTSALVVLSSCAPLILYLSLRIGRTDAENLIQTSLAILASTLFIAASPVHRILFNNWAISDALVGRMTLDGDTVRNLRSLEARKRVGISLILQGEMQFISSRATYASPYYEAGVDPGPMILELLTYHSSHHLFVDQDGVIGLQYGDGNSVAISLVEPSQEGSPRREISRFASYAQRNERASRDLLVGCQLSAKRYVGNRWWYILDVDEHAGLALLY